MPSDYVMPCAADYTAAGRYALTSTTPDPHPDYDDVRCPTEGCREFVNVQCWRCGWVRVEDV